jgi:hypothetical protein
MADGLALAANRTCDAADALLTRRAEKGFGANGEEVDHDVLRVSGLDRVE